jgi:hypothetical protein
MANRFEVIDADGHNTEEAGRLKVDTGSLNEGLHGDQS